MDASEPTEEAFDEAARRAGLTLAPEDRAIALAEARTLHRAAALVRAYVARAERHLPGGE